MSKKNNTYSVDFKINTIERYNSGDEGGVKALSKQLGFRSHNMLTRWLESYNEFGIAGLELGVRYIPLRLFCYYLSRTKHEFLEQCYCSVSTSPYTTYIALNG